MCVYPRPLLCRVTDTLVELAAFAHAHGPSATSAAATAAALAALAAFAHAQANQSAASAGAGEHRATDAQAAVAASLASMAAPNALELVTLAAAVWRRRLRVPDRMPPATPPAAAVAPGALRSGAAASTTAVAGPAEWVRMAELLVASRKPSHAVLWLKRALALAPTHTPAVLMLAQASKKHVFFKKKNLVRHLGFPTHHAQAASFPLLRSAPSVACLSLDLRSLFASACVCFGVCLRSSRAAAWTTPRGPPAKLA